MRNLTKTLAVLSILAPASAHALGVGEIKLHSALNQKLNAEIALSLGAGENAADIQVKLAPIEKFDQSGIPWNPLLRKIKFEPTAKSDGSLVIKLTTNETVTEPFLDLLIEVSSPSGSLYREFTVLVDPPSSYEQRIAPATALPSFSARQYSAPRQPYVQTPRERAPKTAVRHVPAEGIAPGDTIKVRKNDSLLGIAARANVDRDISNEQMAIALFQANPQAFYKNNINALSAGRTLKVPGKEAILRLSRKQASAEFKQQNQQWQGLVAVSPEAQKPAAEEPKLTLQAPAESEVSPQAQEAPAQVEQVKPGTEPGAPAKTVPAQTPADQQLQSRLQELEQKMAEMQKLLEVKDQELKALQDKVPVKPETAAPLPEAVTPAVEIAPPQAEVPAQPPETVTPPPEAVTPPPEAAVPPVPTPAPQPVVETPPPVEPEKPILSYALLGLAGFGMLGLFGWLWARKRKIEEEQSRESMFASSSQISLPTSHEELLVPTVVPEAPGYGISAASETSSFLDPFHTSEFTVIHTDQEVDPISEADVYLAYGRYKQAEELMRGAIAEQPERDECKLKLLEIFYTNNNKQAFEDYAKELLQAGKKGDTAFWLRVAEMGSELIPESPLFADVKIPGSDFIERPAHKEDMAVSGGDAGGTASVATREPPADFSVPEAEEESAGKQEAAPQSESELPKQAENFDFDLSAFEAEAEIETETADSESMPPFASMEPQQPVVESETKEEFEALDFNLDVGATAKDRPADLTSGQKQDAIEGIESFDFISPAETESTSDKIPASTDINLEFDSGVDTAQFDTEISFDEPLPGSDIAAEQTDLESGIPGESGFVSLETMDDEATEDFQNLDFGEGFNLTEMDELETKIDLAKAYIDMGDAQAAKEIAEEVLAKGNPEQKREAQAIIDGL